MTIICEFTLNLLTNNISFPLLSSLLVSFISFHSANQTNFETNFQCHLIILEIPSWECFIKTENESFCVWDVIYSTQCNVNANAVTLLFISALIFKTFSFLYSFIYLFSSYFSPFFSSHSNYSLSSKHPTDSHVCFAFN